jgi:hypothetical protein
MPGSMRVVPKAEGIGGPETKAAASPKEASPKKADDEAAPPHASEAEATSKRGGTLGDDVH